MTPSCSEQRTGIDLKVMQQTRERHEHADTLFGFASCSRGHSRFRAPGLGRDDIRLGIGFHVGALPRLSLHVDACRVAALRRLQDIAAPPA